nr:hypothetical protein [Tanacetum cinerariifolium]
MMTAPTATARYEGQLRTEATHVASGTSIQTDAPVDNHGRGEAFSPTDLVGTALVAGATRAAPQTPGRFGPRWAGSAANRGSRAACHRAGRRVFGFGYVRLAIAVEARFVGYPWHGGRLSALELAARHGEVAVFVIGVGGLGLAQGPAIGGALLGWAARLGLGGSGQY